MGGTVPCMHCELMVTGGGKREKAWGLGKGAVIIAVVAVVVVAQPPAGWICTAQSFQSWWTNSTACAWRHHPVSLLPASLPVLLRRRHVSCELSVAGCPTATRARCVQGGGRPRAVPSFLLLGTVTRGAAWGLFFGRCRASGCSGAMPLCLHGRPAGRLGGFASCGKLTRGGEELSKKRES